MAARAEGGRLGVDDPAAPESAVLEPWRLLAGRGRLPVRVDLLVPAPSPSASALLTRGPETYPGGGRLAITTLLIDAGDAAAADLAARASEARFAIAILVRDAATARAAVGLIAATRTAVPAGSIRLLVAAGAVIPEAERLALERAGLPMVVERGLSSADADAALAAALAGDGAAVAIGSGATGGPPEPPPLAPPADLRWLATGAPADFLVIRSDAAPDGTAPAAIWVGGVEVYRRPVAAKP